MHLCNRENSFSGDDTSLIFVRSGIKQVFHYKNSLMPAWPVTTTTATISLLTTGMDAVLVRVQ